MDVKHERHVGRGSVYFEGAIRTSYYSYLNLTILGPWALYIPIVLLSQFSDVPLCLFTQFVMSKPNLNQCRSCKVPTPCINRDVRLNDPPKRPTKRTPSPSWVNIMRSAGTVSTLELFPGLRLDKLIRGEQSPASRTLLMNPDPALLNPVFGCLS